MSKPKAPYWWSMVSNCLRRYPSGLPSNTFQGAMALAAITAAITETQYTVDGKDRVRVAQMVLIKRTHNYAGAAMVIHVSERTAQRWGRDFMFQVARKMGYITK